MQEIKNKYIEDLREIRTIMARSSRLISLSGLSGIAAGIIGMVGAYWMDTAVYKKSSYQSHSITPLEPGELSLFMVIAGSTLLLALISVIVLTTRETLRRNEEIWDIHTKRLLISLLIPLTAGGLVCLTLIFKGYTGLVAPLCLVFYGLALVNSSKYTIREINSLGILQVFLGLCALHLVEYGLLFWAAGFGLLHIVYGIYMHTKLRA